MTPKIAIRCISCNVWFDDNELHRGYCAACYHLSTESDTVTDQEWKLHNRDNIEKIELLQAKVDNLVTSNDIMIELLDSLEKRVRLVE